MGSKKTITIFGILLILILVGGFFGIKYAKNRTQNERIYTRTRNYR